MSKQQHSETNSTLIPMGISNRIQGVHTRNTRAGDGGGNPHKLYNKKWNFTLLNLQKKQNIFRKDDQNTEKTLLQNFTK